MPSYEFFTKKRDAAQARERVRLAAIRAQMREMAEVAAWKTEVVYPLECPPPPAVDRRWLETEDPERVAEAEALRAHDERRLQA
jgi:hypothetical protein